MPATDDQVARLEADPLTWRLALFERYMSDATGELIPDGPHHHRFWSWLWSITPGRRPRPYVAIWPRRGAKSTNTEMAVAALGARRIRPYGWYVCATQDQADDHLNNVGDMMTAREFATFYPGMSQRRVGRYGESKGWRISRLRTASGFTVDAVGLDTASRGVKLEDERPGFIVIDDVDGTHDTLATTAKLIRTLTDDILPAGSNDLAVIAIQNLVHPTSLFSRLAGIDTEHPVDFLTDRIVSGPVPAIERFTYRTDPATGRHVITGGEPSWIGFDLVDADAELNTIGPTAFLGEFQHEVEPPAGGMFSRFDLAALRVPEDDVPPLTRVVCWLDPAVTKTDQSDAHAISIDGIDGDGRDGTIYRLWHWEKRATPLEALRLALVMAATYGATSVGIETDQGGDLWRSTFREARAIVLADPTTPRSLRERIRTMGMRTEKAGASNESKTERANRMLIDYERGGRRILHVVGTHRTLERALTRFPRTKPFDLVDACYWSWRDLRLASVIAGGDPDPVAADEARTVRDAYTAERRSLLDR